MTLHWTMATYTFRSNRYQSCHRLAMFSDKIQPEKLFKGVETTYICMDYDGKNYHVYKIFERKKFIYRTWIIYYNMNTSQNSVEIPFRCTKRIHQRSYDTLLLGLINAIISGKLYSLIRPLLGNRMPTLHVFQSRRRFHSYWCMLYSK